MDKGALMSRLQAQCRFYNLPIEGEEQILVQRLKATGHWQEFADKYRVVEFNSRVYDPRDDADIEALIRAHTGS